jgi:Flp pilus assembly pilin Flp
MGCHGECAPGVESADIADVTWPYVGPLQEAVMKGFTQLLGSLVRDERGGEVLEYALIAGLIVIAAIATIASVGTKVVARWTSLNSSM